MPAETIGTALQWGGLLALILGLLAVDLGLLQRRERRGRGAGAGAALAWSGAWTAVALLFNLWVRLRFGRRAGLEFLAAYLVERALSFDNLFVFLLIFSYFSVPRPEQSRVLHWGILGTVALRGIFIALGAVLLARFEMLFFVLGAFLVYSGIKLIRRGEMRVAPERNPVAALFRRLVPLTAGFRGKSFLVREGGRILATPLLLVLVMIEATDLAFAVDSIPAVFGVTRHPYIIFSSNIFAILGLRSLYGLLAALAHRFGYLVHGIGLVLVFIGAKMLAARWIDIPIELSLAIVAAVLVLAIAASWLYPRNPRNDDVARR